MCSEIKSLACSFEPPSISIEYLDSRKNTLYRKFNVAFAYFSNAIALRDTLIKDYSEFFNEKTINSEKLLKFTEYIISKAPKIDLKGKDISLIEQYKAQMQREFEMNVIKPGDPEFVYDLKVDFEPGSSDNDWDD